MCVSEVHVMGAASCVCNMGVYVCVRACGGEALQ